mgnify:CR=1 FL=1
MIKIALCLFGQPRFISNYIACNLYKEFILNKYDVDVYGHVWKASSYLTSSWNKIGEVVGDHNVEGIIIDQYPKIKLKVEKPVTFNELNLDANNIISQFYSIEQSVNLIENPDQYRFILVGRWDLLLARFEPIDSLAEGYYTTNRHPSLADQLIFCSPKYLPSIKMFDLTNDPKINEKTFSIEEFKLNYFKKLYIGENIQKYDFGGSLIRNL